MITHKKRANAIRFILVIICLLSTTGASYGLLNYHDVDTQIETGELRDVDQSDKQLDADITESRPLAIDSLDQLPVKGRAPKTGYNRDQFGPAWQDVDGNGCDTRNDILKRDLTDKTYRSATRDCAILSGQLRDPYTGKVIEFKRGEETSLAVQIDHVVALSDAWQKGAQQLTKDRREQLANDPYNLLAVDGDANQQKSDGDASTWLPPNESYRCDYVARQIGVKVKYNLWITKYEKQAIANVLGNCSGQRIPSS